MARLAARVCFDVGMRWDELFADLEAQVEAAELAQRSGEIDERTRSEFGALGLHERLRAAEGVPLRVRLSGQLVLTATLRRVGPDWMLLDEDGGREAVIVLAHVLGVRGLGRRSATPDTAGVIESRLGIRHVLRGIARDRSPCRLHLPDADTVDATIDRVGSDFVEVATHGAGELRRRQDVRDVELLPLAALVAVRRTA